MANRTYLWTADALAKRLAEKYGEGGMTASQIYKEFHIRKAKLPEELESKPIGDGKRKRYALGSVARWWTRDRKPEAPGYWW